MYQVDLTLFGAHHRDRAQHSAEAFYVEIKLEKMLKGKNPKYLYKGWPRKTCLKIRITHLFLFQSQLVLGTLKCKPLPFKITLFTKHTWLNLSDILYFF